MTKGGVMIYTYLIFDADETLYDFKKSERKALELTMKDFEIAYEEAYHLPLYKEINQTLWDKLEEGLITQNAIKVQRFIDYKKALNATYDPKAFAKRFMKHLADGSYLLEGAKSLIESISPSYKLVILTNGLTAVQENRLGKSIIAHHFIHQFISEEIGVAKPNTEIFTHVFKRLEEDEENFKPSKCLMIGDSLSSDIQGGNNAGIDTCWVNLHGKDNNSKASPSYEVNSLQALEKLLLSLN